jgi:predicted nucleic-acid-binding protein
MIGLDSNLIIRLLVLDDSVQSVLAKAVVEDRLTPEKPGFVSVVAIAETAWVLARSYRFAALEVASALERVLQTETLVVDHEAAVFSALDAMREFGADFGDALIWALNAEAGCERTLSFDRDAKRLPGFEHP